MRIRLVTLAALVAVIAGGGSAGCRSAGNGRQVADAGRSAPAPTTGQSTPRDAAQAAHELAQCLRDHGAPAKDPVLPIPPNTRLVTAFGLDPASVSQAQLKQLQQACAIQIQWFNQLVVAPAPWGTTDAQKLAFAKCMRAHGVSRFPDPDPQPADAAKLWSVFPLEQAGVNPDDPAVRSAVQACSAR